MSAFMARASAPSHSSSRSVSPNVCRGFCSTHPASLAGGTRLALFGCVVELVLKITARAKGLPAMIQALAAVMFQARLERGCVDCQLYAETGNPLSLRYVEAWATHRDMESQLRSQRFGMLLAIMETAPEAPNLEVRTVSEQRGLDYIRAVRLGTGTDVRRTGATQPG
jgi:quinol monooxygenase YgiN